MRILVTGASGQLGAYLLAELYQRNCHEVIAWSGREAATIEGYHLTPVRLDEPDSLRIHLDAADPDVILHAAAVSAAEAARKAPERARAINVTATEQIAQWCRDRDRRLVFTSTDMVFDGQTGWYQEEDPPSPVLEYGRTKADAERAVLAGRPGLVVRLSLLFGPSQIGRSSFYDDAIATLKRGEPRRFFNDEFRTPLDYATAAKALVELSEQQLDGIVHLAGQERVSRFTLMRRIAAAIGLDPSLVEGNSRDDVAGFEPRPADLSLKTDRLAELLPNLTRPSIEEAARLMTG